jgi:hypothetical protein
MDKAANTPKPVDNFKSMETRYFCSLYARNVLNKPVIKFVLSREFIDNNEVARILEANGYNSNHPGAEVFISQIKKSFTLPEVDHFLNCLPPSTVCSVEIIPFFIMDMSDFDDYLSVEIQSGTRYKILDFSELVDGTLPFPIVGYYEFEWSN